jgi:hypothetical protein
MRSLASSHVSIAHNQTSVLTIRRPFARQTLEVCLCIGCNVLRLQSATLFANINPTIEHSAASQNDDPTATEAFSKAPEVLVADTLSLARVPR